MTSESAPTPDPLDLAVDSLLALADQLNARDRLLARLRIEPPALGPSMISLKRAAAIVGRDVATIRRWNRDDGFAWLDPGGHRYVVDEDAFRAAVRRRRERTWR